MTDKAVYLTAGFAGSRYRPRLSAGGIKALDLHPLAAHAHDNQADHFIAFLDDFDGGTRSTGSRGGLRPGSRA